jgi:hypothetical protein
MAQEESEREDLLREATALVERVELVSKAAEDSEHVFAGFRRDGSFSIYFGSDPAYHFNSRGELRRAFAAGLLIKAEHGRLVSLDRRRIVGEVQLVRHALSDVEQAEFLARLERRIADLSRQCEANDWDTIGCVPANADVLGRLGQWLARHAVASVAKSPHAR